jgi:hypothetical protein
MDVPARTWQRKRAEAVSRFGITIISIAPYGGKKGFFAGRSPFVTLVPTTI